MSLMETFTQVFDSSYQTLCETGLYKNPNDVSPFLKLPKNTIVTKIAGRFSESWWIVELNFNSKTEIGFIVAKTLTTFITAEKNTKISLNFTIEALKTLFPKADNNLLEALVNEAKTLFPKYQLTTQSRIAHFLAQIAVESAYFTTLEENLNYSSARLLEVFPNRITPLDALNFAHRPKLIANKIYANRLGNGSEPSGDGYKFRGRGFIQLTGRSNYRDIGKLINQPLEENPDLLLTPKYALESALGYWQMRKINAVADSDNVKAVTAKINAALLHLNQRTTLYSKLRFMLEG